MRCVYIHGLLAGLGLDMRCHARRYETSKIESCPTVHHMVSDNCIDCACSVDVDQNATSGQPAHICLDSDVRTRIAFTQNRLDNERT